METCCWYSSTTCCGVRNQVYDLALVSYFSQREEQSTNLSQQSINDQIKDLLSERGLEPDYYVALTGLMCIWCESKVYFHNEMEGLA